MVLCNSNPRKLIQRVLEIITVKILWGSEKSQDKKKIKFWSFQDRVLKECEDRWGKEKRLREMAKKSMSSAQFGSILGLVVMSYPC